MLSQSDILPLDVFSKQRLALRKEIISIKKDRRIHIGTDITLYIENKKTLLWQVHEMLRVEGGGLDQIQDELTAYAPLCPKKFSDNYKEVSITLMIEITNPTRRHDMLKKLSHIENHIYFTCHNERLQVMVIEDNIDRVNDEGKTSAVHFLKISFPPSFQEFLKAHPLSIQIEHPHYRHSAELMPNQQLALLEDLAKLD